MGHFQGIILFFVFLFYVHAHALTNSQPAYHDSNNFNVWLTIKGEYKGEEIHGLCNGSLIAEDLVVTAAHCLVDSTNHENQIEVHVGKYKTTKGSRMDFTAYHSSLDVVKSKKIYFLNAVDKKIRSKKLLGLAGVSANHDIALIELERPIDRSKLDIKFVNFVTPSEHAQIVANPNRYTFIALTINLIAEMSTNYKRYAEVKGVKFSGPMNKAYNLPMINPRSPVATEPGDSGAPVLVNISGEWKLFSVIKGDKRDFLSSKLEEWTGSPINITPAVNVFSPVGNKMCELLRNAGRSCQ